MGAFSGPETVDDGIVLALDAAPNPRYVDYAGRGANFSASGDYLTIADSNVFSPGTGDYTVEGWFRWASNGWWNRLVSADDGSSTSMYLYTFRDNEPAVYINGAYMNPGVSPVMVYNQWYHMAVSRVSGTTYFFRNGVLLQSSTNATINGSITSSNVRICTSLTSPQQFYGDASNIRIVVGDGLASHYTSAFTPPTEPLTAVSGTTLLLCQNGSFTKDNSGYNRTVTTNGSPAKSSLDLGTPFGDLFNLANNTGIGTITNGPVFTQEPKQEPFGGAGAVEFDGTGWMTTPSSATFNMGTGDFTVEAWINLDNFDLDASANPTIFGNSGGSYQQQVYVTSAGKVIAGNTGSSFMESGTTLVAGNWYHIAVSRESGTGRLFVNGTLEDTEASWTTDLNGTVYYIGAFDNGTNGKIEGYISNLRIIKGTALYTSNFTPKRQPILPESAPNTVLLTCQKGTIRDRSSSAHAITINGNAKSISGASYFEFDGTNDYVTIPDSDDFDIGPQNTMECWIKINTIGTDKLFFGKLNTWWFAMGYSAIGVSANRLGISFNDGSAWNGIQNTYNISIGTWYHLVATWDGTNIRLYVNGVLESTSSDLSSKTWNTSSSTLDIGGYSGNSSTSTNCDISNARVYHDKALTAAEVKQNYRNTKGRYGL